MGGVGGGRRASDCEVVGICHCAATAATAAATTATTSPASPTLLWHNVSHEGALLAAQGFILLRGHGRGGKGCKWGASAKNRGGWGCRQWLLRHCAALHLLGHAQGFQGRGKL